VVTKVNAEVLNALMTAGLVPVIAPVGLNGNRQDGMPLTLNFNADIIAGDIAAAVNADKLIFLTDVAGILDNSKQLISRLNMTQAKELIESEVASGGMIPKVQACLRALSATVSTCIVDGRQPHALVQTIEEHYPGTIITR
jgi:acetylglutamate kinase